MPLLFKLHWPENFIVCGGFFASYSRLPVSIVWETFGIKNGAATYAEMRARIEHYRRMSPSPREDFTIGNVILQDPSFLTRDRWIPAPPDFNKNVVKCGLEAGRMFGLGTRMTSDALANVRSWGDPRPIELSPA